MGINIGGIKIEVPSVPVKVPDPSDVINGIGDVGGQMSDLAKSGFLGATNALSSLAGEFKDGLEQEALKLAVQYKQNGGDDFNDCVPMVTAGMAFLGAKLGGALGAAVGAGGGLYAARIACRRVFPTQDDPGDEAMQHASGSTRSREYVVTRVWNRTRNAVSFRYITVFKEEKEVTLKPNGKWWQSHVTDQTFWQKFADNGIKVQIGNQIFTAVASVVSSTLPPDWNTPSDVTGRVDYLQLVERVVNDQFTVVADIVQTS